MLVTAHATDYHDDRHATRLRCGSHGTYALAAQCLCVEMPLSGHHEIRRREMGVEMQRVEHHAGPGEEFRFEEGHQARSQSACSTCARKIEHIHAEITLDNRRVMTECVVQLAYHLWCCSLLRTINGGSAIGTTQRIIHVTGDLHHGIAQAWIERLAYDASQPGQRSSTKRQLLPLLV